MTVLDIRRKNSLNLFREGSKLASFDEFPLLRSEVDPQLHVSRNEVDQPFFLCCEKDTVLALVSGAARVEFATGGIRFFELEPGDFVYVPGGASHRISVTAPGIQLRYKAREAGRESAAWYCGNCSHELFCHEWDTVEHLPQEGYLSACEDFNANLALRKCPECGEEHPLIAMENFRWRDVADTLRGEGGSST